MFFYSLLHALSWIALSVLWSFFVRFNSRFLASYVHCTYIQNWERTHNSANDTFLSNKVSHSIFGCSFPCHAFIWMYPFRYAYKVLFVGWCVFCKLNVFEHWIRSSLPFPLACSSLFLLRFFVMFFFSLFADLFSGLFFFLFLIHLRLGYSLFFLLFLVNVCVISMVIAPDGAMY